MKPIPSLQSLFVVVCATIFQVTIIKTDSPCNITITNNNTSAPVFINSIKEVVKEAANKLTGYSKQCEEALPSIYSTIGQTWHTHRFKIVSGTLLGMYAGLYGALWNYQSYMKNNELWFNWKQDYNMEELSHYTHQELAKELVVAIHKRYLNPENPSDALTPLTIFLAETKREERALKNYRSLMRMLSYKWISSWFSIDQEKAIKLQQKIDRLLFVKHIFLSWAAEQNWINNADLSLHKNSLYRSGLLDDNAPKLLLYPTTPRIYSYPR